MDPVVSRPRVDPTDVLMNEHLLIKQMLRCLEALARRCDADGTLDEPATREALSFFRDYADRYHHAKEESILFPLLQAKGLAEHDSLTGDLVAEHALGRFHLDALEQALAGAVAGEPEATRCFGEHARDYTRMLRRHMRREDDFLFPMADIAMSSGEREAVLTAFDEVDREARFRGLPERCRQTADRLADRCGVVKETVRFGAG